MATCNCSRADRNCEKCNMGWIEPCQALDPTLFIRLNDAIPYEPIYSGPYFELIITFEDGAGI
jgi:hypothetical protein